MINDSDIIDSEVLLNPANINKVQPLNSIQKEKKFNSLDSCSH